MWHIVLVDYHNKHHRQEVVDGPTCSELRYWEKYYSTSVDPSSRSRVNYATVINVFKTED
ncbi:hypothetical protein D3C85_1165740 [compost metagenome]